MATVRTNEHETGRSFPINPTHPKQTRDHPQRKQPVDFTYTQPEQLYARDCGLVIHYLELQIGGRLVMTHKNEHSCSRAKMHLMQNIQYQHLPTDRTVDTLIENVMISKLVDFLTQACITGKVGFPILISHSCAGQLLNVTFFQYAH